MEKPPITGLKLVIVGAAAAFVVGALYFFTGMEDPTRKSLVEEIVENEAEGGSFGHGAGENLTGLAIEGGLPRTLVAFYDLRAYPGAPPVIPHEVKFGGVIADDCLSCHENGGFSPEHNAYSPVTPHPEKESCTQCHVEGAEPVEFVFAGGSDWEKPLGPALGRAAIAGGPPPIPHTLDFRGVCQSCHAGPHAVVEVRSPHPEREHCQQCHLLKVTSQGFVSQLGKSKQVADEQK